VDVGDVEELKMLAMQSANEGGALVALGVGLIAMAIFALLIARPYSNTLESVRRRVRIYDWWVSLFMDDRSLNSPGRLRMNRILCVVAILIGLGLISFGLFQLFVVGGNP
jgi:hypothetical protein